MKLEWIFLAEGFGRDAKQAVTAIGINQTVHVTDELPVVTKRGVFAHVTDPEGLLKEGDTISMAMEVKSPSGRIVAAQAAEVAMGQLPWPDLPTAVDVVAELQLRLSEFGSYAVSVSLTHFGAGGETKSAAGEVAFHVLQQPSSASTAPTSPSQ